MNSTHTLDAVRTPGTKTKVVGRWALKIAFALLFIGAGGAKLAGVSAMVAEFDQVGLGQWFRYATGLLEVLGAILLIVPRTALYGASLLAVICLGALVAQLAVIHQDWVHCVAMAALLGLIAWSERPPRTIA